MALLATSVLLVEVHCVVASTPKDVRQDPRLWRARKELAGRVVSEQFWVPQTAAREFAKRLSYVMIREPADISVALNEVRARLTQVRRAYHVSDPSKGTIMIDECIGVASGTKAAIYMEVLHPSGRLRWDTTFGEVHGEPWITQERLGIESNGYATIFIGVCVNSAEQYVYVFRYGDWRHPIASFTCDSFTLSDIDYDRVMEIETRGGGVKTVLKYDESEKQFK